MFSTKRSISKQWVATLMVVAALTAACAGNAATTVGKTMGRESTTIAPSVSNGAGIAAMPPQGMPGANEAKGDSATASGVVSSSAPTDGSGGAQASADILGRKVIRNGTMGLEVESVADAYDRVSATATRAGGYVQEGSYSGAGDSRSATIVLRVPAERYDQVVAELRGIAKEVRNVGMQTHDATGEVSDMEATLRNLRAVEAQYVTLLTRANAINDVLLVQDRLRQVRLEIDRTDARLALTTRLTDLATITVQLSPVQAAASRVVRTPLDAAGAAWAASLDTLRVLATVVVTVVVYSWWLLPVFALAGYFGRRLLRMRRMAVASV